MHDKKEKELTLQGRRVTTEDITLIRNLIVSNPDWHRTRLSRELCVHWNWHRSNGGLKDMACRSLLVKLEKRGYIVLPRAMGANYNASRKSSKYSIQSVLHSKVPIRTELRELYPIVIQVVESGYELIFFKYLISAYHYLGWSGTVGENLKYLYFDKLGRPLGCMMFGAAAWKVTSRDRYIDWDAETRKRNLSYIANNNRFLILPWVQTKCLGSHILGKICRRLNQDWLKKYNHPIYLLETFVEKERFRGTCYKAANWIYVGDTKGRGKLDVKNEYALPIKSTWLYPLEPLFRNKLCDM